MTAAIDSPNAAMIDRQATPPDTAFVSRRPKAALMRNPANGRSGISTSMELAPLPLERGERVGIQRFPMAEERDHEREADRRFRGRDRHDEEGDDLAIDRAEIAADGDE